MIAFSSRANPIESISPPRLGLDANVLAVEVATFEVVEHSTWGAEITSAPSSSRAPALPLAPPNRCNVDVGVEGQVSNCFALCRANSRVGDKRSAWVPPF